jgi:hypothetical protein
MVYLPRRVFLLFAAVAVVVGASGVAELSAGEKNADRIQPYAKNLRYWQYQGKPVMLLGGSATDHLFLLEGLKAHLDEMSAVGANYVRNTMSQREGQELKPHKLLASGKFDLDQWNEEYWRRFQNLLKWTAERKIVVQIEVWDRFDFSRENWETSPWNPQNNVTYTYPQTSFARTYPAHPSRDLQPFFHSIEGMPRYGKKLDLVRKYQEAFVAKMLSYSLDCGHVLYCMDNETSTPAEWGKYWIEFIQSKAAEKGVTVCTTDMFDDAFEARKSAHTPIIFKDAKHYMFADISQVNSRNYDEAHWESLRWLLRQVNTHPRPSNHTKIYGSGYKSFGTGGPEDGVQRFWRNIIGGSAAARFHRPDSGNGLNDFAKGAIKAARLVESQIKFWDITPHMELLAERVSNEAYLAAKPGEGYALYFTNGGSVRLNLSAAPGTFEVTWISVSMGIPIRTSATGGYRLRPKSLAGGKVVTLSAPYKGGWVAVLVKR